jgi:hypothetical protein
MITNNDILKKLRVALQLRDTDIIAILRLADFETSASELSAIFRKEGHPQYMPCGDQILRRFLDGLIIRNRGKREAPAASTSVATFVPLPDKPQHRAAQHKPAARHGGVERMTPVVLGRGASPIPTNNRRVPDGRI